MSKNAKNKRRAKSKHRDEWSRVPRWMRLSVELSHPRYSDFLKNIQARLDAVRRKDPDKLAEFDALYVTYLSAIGDGVETEWVR